MEVTTLTYDNLHNHGELFANMFRARHRAFIQQNKWDLPEANGMEFDQYDTPASRWVVVHDDEGKVLAGNRLTPTTHGCGIYSYMIRDAQRGLLAEVLPIAGTAPGRRRGWRRRRWWWPRRLRWQRWRWRRWWWWRRFPQPLRHRPS